MNTRGQPLKIPSTVWALGWASLLTDVSSEMVYPLLPSFLATVLGATAIQLGLIEGIAEATAAFLKVFSGVWADRTPNRKPMILLGYGFSGLFRPLIGAAVSWPWVLVCRFLDRVGKGIRSSPRDALIADVTDRSARGQAYGLHRGMDHAGAMIGPLVASVLLLWGLTLRQVFLAAVLPAILGVAVITLRVSDVPRAKLDKTSAPSWGETKKLAKGNFRWLLGSFCIFGLGNASDAFLLLRLSTAGVSPAGVAVLWSIQHAIKMLANFAGGRLSDHMGRKRALVLGWLIYSATYLGFALVNSQEALITVFLLYGLFYGLVEPSERALVAECAPPELRGTAFGVFYLVTGLSIFPASLVFGLLWQFHGPLAAFGLGAGLAFLASAVLTLKVSSPNGKQFA